MEQLTIQQAFDLAVRQHQGGQLAEAERLYRQILSQQPAHAEAMQLWGMIAHQRGQDSLAVDLIGNSIALNPKLPHVHNNLGMVLRRQGKLDGAIAAYQMGISLNPNIAEIHNNLGNAFKEKGQLDDAIAAYRQATVLRPEYADAQYNLGNALKETARIDEAIVAYGQAVASRPGFLEAHTYLGNALKDKGRLDEALVAYREAVAINPNVAGVHNNLGNCLAAQWKLDDAIVEYRKAIMLEPAYADVYSNLGNALKEQGELDEAIAAYRQAIVHKPGYAQAFSNLGSALKDKGQLDEAIAAYRQAVSLDPDLADAQSNIIYAMQFHPGCNAGAIAREQDRWNREYAQPLQAAARPLLNNCEALRRLKVGYVSPDFRAHAESFFVAPLLRCHDHQQFEIHCYASVIQPDETTAVLKGYADFWHEVIGESDERLAERIRQDQIDVLVDLTMHMANNRLRTFARKPAPVQVTWLAYPGGTGLSAMDYRLTDAFMDPPGNDACYVEKSVRLPGCWCCYDPLSQPLPIGPPPQTKMKHVTFGSLNNFCKINQEVLGLWSRVLCDVPDSRLLLLAGKGEHRKRTLDFLESRGVVPERVEFNSLRPREQYLRMYDRIDIALDPFPYNGITTTCDALWMGVPVVSCVGGAAASRAGLSLLSMAGLGELVGHTPEQFVQIAVELANDLPRLTQLRSTLRQRMEQSLLMDAPKFARNVEAAYRRMWQSWCAST